MTSKILSLFLFSLAFTLSQGASSEEGIVLDLESDLSPEWNLTETQQYCTYSRTHTDFDFAWGCPLPIEENGVDVADVVGIWSSCQRAACDIIYDGSENPKPFSITLKLFLKGSSQLIVTAKTNKNFDQKIATIRSGEVGTGLTRIQLKQFPDAQIFKFTMTSSDGGYAAIDHITMDFVERADPTTPPPVIDPVTEAGGRGAPEALLVLISCLLLKLLNY